MRSILTVNGGSSSIRFAVYAVSALAPGTAQASLERTHHGKIDRIGLAGANLTVASADAAPLRRDMDAADHRAAGMALIGWLDEAAVSTHVAAIGHRVVHGMDHAEPVRITPALLRELRGIAAYDPEHLPRELELIELLGSRFAGVPQIACFDTAFHRTMPDVAARLPIPRRYHAEGVRRYGFHGLSYSYLLRELCRIGDPAAARGRVILAHLGNGASLAAVRDGRGIDTSMGFTPASGLVMGSRSGDLDPGLALYFARSAGKDAAQFDAMINHESGLRGVSETSSDVRDLLAREAADTRAADALALFCYQAKKWIGAYAAALGGLDTLVFSGGIGENAAPIRARICAGLEFLGLDLDADRNARALDVISGEHSAVTVRVIRTDEEWMIARSSLDLLART